MPYDCQLFYRSGRNEENLADFISRHPNASEVQGQNVAEEYANYVCINAIPKAMTIQEVEVETQKDPTMQAVVEPIGTGNWSAPEVQEYTKIKQELAVHKGIILRGNRLVIPPTLRNKAVDLAHIWQQGTVKTETFKGENQVSWNRQAYRREDKKLPPLPGLNARKLETVRTSEDDPITQWSLERSCYRLCRTLSF